MPPDAPRCPRRDYDLSGAAALFTQQCPLEGRCSECGLELAWRDVLDPKYGVVKGFYEHARGLRPWWLVRTWAGMHCPSRFWGRVRMHGPIRFARAAATVILAVIIAHACVGASALVFVHRNPWANTTGLQSPWYELRLLAEPYSVHSEDVFSTWRLGWVFASVSAPAAVIVVPIGFALLPSTLRTSRVRRAHLARIWIYAMGASMSITPIALVAVKWTLAYGPWPWDWNSWWPYVPLFAPAALMTGWHWFASVRRYLLLPHARAVAGAMLTMAALVGGLAGSIAVVLVAQARMG